MKLGDKDNLKKKLDKEIIILFKDEVEKNKGIELYFTKYLNNYIELKNQYDTGLDKSQTSKRKIEYLCKKSIFVFN